MFQAYNHENDISLSKKEQLIELSSDSGLKMQFSDYRNRLSVSADLRLKLTNIEPDM
jgi:hypothetical protein